MTFFNRKVYQMALISKGKPFFTFSYLQNICINFTVPSLDVFLPYLLLMHRKERVKRLLTFAMVNAYFFIISFS